MNNAFATAAKKTANFTRTENGAVALKSTGHACVDFFGVGGSLRGADKTRVETLFEEAWLENPLTAVKTLFYIRDIRGDEKTTGLGERETFRTLLRYCAKKHPSAVLPNMDLIGVYGRYDDMYCLVGTPLEDAMWAAMKRQLEEDLVNLREGNAVSLLAKWIKTADASSKKTRQLGILTARKLGYPVYHFKRIVRTLRKHIGVVEALMSAGRWDEIKYSAVPSRAMLIYRNAFQRHDADRFGEFAQKAAAGEISVNSGTLYPYDIVEKFLSDSWGGWRPRRMSETEENLLQAQWDQLPNYVEEGQNVIVMADTSGSMSGRPIYSALGLAVYFAQRNTGAYHNLFMTFSERPAYQVIRGTTLRQVFSGLDYNGWDNNTNLHAAFKKILQTALDNSVPAEEMPKSIVVISDMEIDNCGDRNWSFYDQMRAEYAQYGYEIPSVVFWNVNSRHDVFHADANRRGVILCSGQSTGTFKNLIGSIGMTPEEFMMRVVYSDRYEPVTVQ